SCKVRVIASKQAQLRAALPVPPYTTRSSGRSATSGSRLFCSIRSGASVWQLLAVIRVPRGLFTSRGWLTTSPSSFSLVGAFVGCRSVGRGFVRSSFCSVVVLFGRRFVQLSFCSVVVFLVPILFSSCGR